VNAKAFAPATVANVAVGFDILGFPIEAVGDTVTVTKINQPGIVRVASIEGLDGLPFEPTKNTASVGLVQMLKDLQPNFGFEIAIEKGIPLSSGMGGSAASAVAALVAANSLLDKDQRLSNEQLLKYAAESEGMASGAIHFDNVAPCLFGGLTLTLPPKKGESAAPLTIAVPENIFCVLVHPDVKVATKDSRGVLKAEIPLHSHVQQSAHLAAFLLGCLRHDMALIRRAFEDCIIEGQRKHLIPGFDAVKAAAMKNGALGCSISGSGPSVFAWVDSKSTAEVVKEAMIAAFHANGVAKVEGWVSPISTQGARLVP